MKQLSSKYADTSIISGTHREVDLIEAFSDFLYNEGFRNELDEEIRGYGLAFDSDGISVVDAPGVDDLEAWCDAYRDDASDLVNNRLWPLLEDIAPEGCYFGAHPDDGSDFGFWTADADYRVRPRQRGAGVNENFAITCPQVKAYISKNRNAEGKVLEIESSWGDTVYALYIFSSRGTPKITVYSELSSGVWSELASFEGMDAESQLYDASFFGSLTGSMSIKDTDYRQRGRQRPASHSPQVQEAIDAVNNVIEWERSYVEENDDFAEAYAFIPFESGGRAMEFYSENINDELGDLLDELGIGEAQVRKAVLDLGERNAEAVFYPGYARANDEGKLTIYQTNLGEHEVQLDDETVELLQALSPEEIEEVRREVEAYMSDRNLDLIYLNYDYDYIVVRMNTEDVEEWLRDKYGRED